MEYKVILGGFQWLGFARARIRALRLCGLANATQSFVMPDEGKIKVTISGQDSFIRLEGGPPTYQFFATGITNLLENITGPTGSLTSVTKGYAVTADLVKVEGAYVIKAKACGSTVETSPSGSLKSWSLIAPAIDITRAFPRQDLWQIQGISEYAHYKSTAGTLNKFGTTISSWGSANPILGLNAFGGAQKQNLQTSDITDVFYDVSPAPIPGQTQVPDADWYRRAARRIVTSGLYGEREFFLMVDASAVLHVWPKDEFSETDLIDGNTYQSQGIKTNIKASAAKKVTLPLPAWAAAPSVVARDVISSFISFPRFYALNPPYKWQFNSTATKMCAVVFERLSGCYYSGGPGTMLLDGMTYQLKEALPGLVELGITITLTGPNPEEFTMSAAVAQVQQPTVTKSYIMAADYAWPVEGKAALDDILTLVGRVFHTSDQRVAVDANQRVYPLNMKSLLEVRNFTQSTVIRTLLASDTNGLYLSAGGGSVVGTKDLAPGVTRWVASGAVLALDLRTLSYVIQQKLIEMVTTWSPGNTDFTETDGASQARRLKVYVKDTLEHEVVMEPGGSDIDGRLVTKFANTDATGLFEWDITSNAVYVRTAVIPTAYNAMNVEAFYQGSFATHYEEFAITAGLPGFNFDAGAYLYNTTIGTALQLDAWDVFAVNPNGSWTLHLNPVFYHTGPVAQSNVGTGLNTRIDTSLFRQAYVDIVSLQPGVGDAIRTSHRALYNEAYAKAATTADFAYQFAKLTDTPSGNTYLKAYTQSGANLLFPTKNSFVGAGALQPHEFDARFPRFLTNSLQTPGEPVIAGTPTLMGEYLSFRRHSESLASLGRSQLFC